jgi:hypothetical protein
MWSDLPERSCVYLALTPEPDAASPLCAMTRYAGGPPTQIDITVQDTVINSDNSTVTVPSFIFGTTDPVVITATKSNQSLPSRINLAVGDVDGNCAACDPILTHILNGKGSGRVQTFTDVDAMERIVTVTNGNPGLKSFEVLVNGRKFRLSKLRNSERRSLDISRAMQEGSRNVLTLYGNGIAGSRADILIWDGGGR